jgi:uncharacterized protein
MIHDNESSNKSGNRTFEDILYARMSRRNVIIRSTVLSATGFLAALAGNKSFVESASAAITQSTGNSVPQNRNSAIALGSSLINFPIVPVANGSGPIPNISSDYQYDVLIPWGTPLQPGDPLYDGNPNSRPTASRRSK